MNDCIGILSCKYCVYVHNVKALQCMYINSAVSNAHVTSICVNFYYVIDIRLFRQDCLIIYTKRVHSSHILRFYY